MFFSVSVMNATYLRDKAPCNGDGCVGTASDARIGEIQAETGAKAESEERGILQRAEALTDRFCEQVRGDCCCTSHLMYVSIPNVTSSRVSKAIIIRC